MSIFRTNWLVSGGNPSQLRLQLNRWVEKKKILKLSKGCYVLNKPYLKVNINPFVISNGLKKNTYISFQSALSWYGMIPEYVPSVTAVGMGRPQIYENEINLFYYHHIAAKYYWGYKSIESEHGENFIIAECEKALLDLLYFSSFNDTYEFIKGLRLQNLSKINISKFIEFAIRFNKPKVTKAIEAIKKIIEEEENTVEI